MARGKKRLSEPPLAGSAGSLLVGIDAGALDGVERFIRIIRESVSFVSVFEGEEGQPLLDVPTFLHLQTLAILDRYFRLPDTEILAVLAYDDTRLWELRAHPRYQDMLTRVTEAGRRLAGPQSIQEIVEGAEATIGHELLLSALEPAGERGKLAKNMALAQVVDRLAAKKGRTSDRKVTVYLPENLEANIEFGLRITGLPAQTLVLGGGGGAPEPLALPPADIAEGEVIDASVLNVPALGPRTGGSPGEE